MTADRLQAVVLRLANAHPTRYWLHWNDPVREPWLMAVKVDPGHPAFRDDSVAAGLRELGFRYAGYGCLAHENVWTIERTDGQGRPYQSLDTSPGCIEFRPPEATHA